VIATASTANHEHLKNLGAHETIDYRQQRFEDVVSDIEVVIDLVGGEVADRSLEVLRDGGTLTPIVPAAPDILAARQEIANRRYIRTTVTNMAQFRDMNVLRRIADLIDAGELATVVTQRIQLGDVAQGLTESMTGHARGKTIVVVNG
jgi:NADPH:quinone reductase-like Zn-dependent oxidoreductase